MINVNCTTVCLCVHRAASIRFGSLRCTICKMQSQIKAQIRDWYTLNANRRSVNRKSIFFPTWNRLQLYARFDFGDGQMQIGNPPFRMKRVHIVSSTQAAVKPAQKALVWLREWGERKKLQISKIDRSLCATIKTKRERGREPARVSGKTGKEMLTQRLQWPVKWLA